MKNYYVYIITNQMNTVLYTGVTNDLIRRIFKHKKGEGSGFTRKYKLTKLVYYENFTSIIEAIEREKQIKGGSRKKKIDLIETVNNSWKDLYTELS